MPENELIWSVYSRVIGQLTSNGALNVLAVYETMDRLEIPRNEQIEMLDQIKVLDSKVFKEFRS